MMIVIILPFQRLPKLSTCGALLGDERSCDRSRVLMTSSGESKCSLGVDGVLSGLSRLGGLVESTFEPNGSSKAGVSPLSSAVKLMTERRVGERPVAG